jgi:2-keto-4-pentenoate hydratase/2-oxohepta-3-ene-1,7-dioic acid hydratase in catechol pathway
MASAVLPGLRGDSHVKHYVRYRRGRAQGYAELEGDSIYPLRGSVLEDRKRAGEKIAVSDVKLLYPIEAPKVFAVGLNYKSHLGGRPAPSNPEIFYKPVTALQHPGDPIQIPPGSKDLHYEAEFVIVIGKGAKGISEAQAPEHILGYTCGNDVSERNWQGGSVDGQKDLQWWRGKGCDTFGPMGPSIAVGLDYMKSEITMRLNGEIKQQQKISDLLFRPEQIVSFISQYVTLTAGDVIFTGTPGSTSAMESGDVCEVEVTGIGVLRNPVQG